MTTSRTAVCGLLLGLLLLWLPSGVGAQGNIDCRAAVDNLFKKADDLSIRDNVINDELTSLSAKCKVKESDSILRLPRYREQVKAAQEETDSSERRADKSGKKMEQSAKEKSSPPDSGMPSAKAPSPKDQLVDKFLQDCSGKSVQDANCDKLKKDFVNILKEDLLRLGSTANRRYMPTILRMFWSNEAELRIAAADAIGMIGPQDSDVEALAPLINDPVPDVRQAVSQMLSRGKGTALTLLKQRAMPMRTGRTPETPVDAGKYSMPVAPNSTYLFDSSDASVGRLSYVAKGKSDPTAFFKTKAKKGPFKLDEFQEKYRYQIQDEREALDQAQQAAGKEIENTKPPDPRNMQAYKEFMEKIQSMGARQGSRIYLDSFEPNLFGSPTVFVLEERQIDQRSYPTRYVVLYQEQAFKRPGYRLAWMTVPDNTIKAAQVTSLADEKQEAVQNKEAEALKKRDEALDNMIQKKGEQEKQQFKKGQADLEKELGF